MDFICSLTGKSPSTTGFGSEGALTKGPFNALPPVVDINNALVSAILTGYAGFTTAAGHMGPNYRVDHDNSMLVPELWCRMRVAERDPQFLIENGYLEKVEDFEYEGRKVLASRLGYRITALFVDRFLGRIFEMPNAVFPRRCCARRSRIWLYSQAAWTPSSRRSDPVALNYFEDGSVEAACPPIKALLHIMAYGEYEGMRETDRCLRAMFTRDSLLASEWYKNRLRAKQTLDTALWTRHRDSLDIFMTSGTPAPQIDLETRLAWVRQQLNRVKNESYLQELVGTIGADPSTIAQL